MGGVTTRWALPYPVGTDIPDVPNWMNQLAVALDNVAMDDQGTLAARPVSTGASPGKRGRYYLVTGDPSAVQNGRLYRDNGTGWDEIAIGGGHVAGDYKISAQTASHGPRADGLFNWLLADGTETPAGYTVLISALAGNPFGVGAGGRPNLPDLRGRFPLAVGTPTGAAGATAHALGQKAGEETHVITAPELPPHAHGVPVNAAVGSNNTAGYGSATAASNITTDNGPGTSTPHNNLPPYVAMGSWFVKT